jgi:hypothetical protein
MWQLRQEMEHARTLIEMIRKREKLKRDLLVTRADIILSNVPNFETDHEMSEGSPDISTEWEKVGIFFGGGLIFV